MRVCARECVCTLLISQAVHVFIPYCPPPPFKTGDCLQSQYVLESYPPLPASAHLSFPPHTHTHSNSWRGHMMHSIYLSPPVVRLQGISVAWTQGLNERGGGKG